MSQQCSDDFAEPIWNECKAKDKKTHPNTFKNISLKPVPEMGLSFFLPPLFQLKQHRFSLNNTISASFIVSSE